MEKLDFVYQETQNSYRKAETLMSSLYDRYMKNPEDEEIKAILIQAIEVAKGINKTQEATLELYPENVKETCISGVNDINSVLDESIDSLMLDRTK